MTKCRDKKKGTNKTLRTTRSGTNNLSYIIFKVKTGNMATRMVDEVAEEQFYVWNQTAKLWYVKSNNSGHFVIQKVDKASLEF